MKRMITLIATAVFLCIVVISTAVDAASVSADFGFPVFVGGGGGATCPLGTSLPDGCLGAPAGTPQLSSTSPPHDSVFGCTPTTTGGPGGVPGCAPTVHYGRNAAAYAVRPPWNIPGIDYHVGCSLSTCSGAPTGAVVGKVPNSTNLTASCGGGASVSGNRVTVSGDNCTLDGYDFCAASTVVTLSGDHDKISNSRLCGFSGQGNDTAIWIPGTNPTVTAVECDGTVFPNNMGECYTQATGAGTADTMTATYVYAHDLAAKSLYWSPGRNATLNYKYNFTYKVAVGSIDHGEELFLSANNDPTLTGEIGYNLSIPVTTGQSTTSLTGIWNWGSPNCCTSDPHNASMNGWLLDHGVFIIGKNWGGSVTGFGVGCSSGGGGCESPLPSGTGNMFVSNYIDSINASFSYSDNCANSGLTVCGEGGANTFSSVTGNVDLTTNTACNPAYVASGRAQGAGVGNCQ